MKKSKKVSFGGILILFMFSALSINLQAQYLQVKKKNAKIRTIAGLNGNVLEEVPKGTLLTILEEAKSSNNNYYKVKCTTIAADGWVVMTSVRKVKGELPDEAFKEETFATNVFGFGQMPPEFYQTVYGLKGPELKLALHKLISNHKRLDYDEVYTALNTTDQDPYDTMNVILIYTSRSQNRKFKDKGGRYDYKQHGYIYQDSWNREHIWPRSLGYPYESDTAYTDLHQIRPADRTVNKERNTRSFGYGTIPYYDNDGTVKTECFLSNDWQWEPPDHVKGDIARMVFYMAVRYEGYEKDGQQTGDLEIIDKVNPKGSKTPELGILSVLLDWHRNDPVDNWERRRNSLIYSKFQGNRNPFIDHPEFVDRVWKVEE